MYNATCERAYVWWGSNGECATALEQAARTERTRVNRNAAAARRATERSAVAYVCGKPVAHSVISLPSHIIDHNFTGGVAYLSYMASCS